MSSNKTSICISRRRFLSTLGTSIAAGALTPPISRGAKADLHEASFYTKLEDEAVKCTLCPTQCVVPHGMRGICEVRENRHGTYYSLVYGHPCTTQADPIEKKPFFHVLPGTKAYSIATVGCNIDCKFCQNWSISQKRPEQLRTPYVAPADIAKQASITKCRTVAYTYSEPTVFYEYVVDCAKAAQEQTIGNVVISNGFIAEKPLKHLIPLLTAMKVDLKAFTENFYRDVCSGQLKPVLETLKRLKDSGLWFEIVVLLIPTLNDGEDEIRKMSEWIVKELSPDVPLHFSRYHPTYKLKIPQTPTHTVMKAREIALSAGCKFVYAGNMPGQAGEHTYCPSCKKIVIERYHYLIKHNRLKDGKCPDCAETIPGVWT